MKAQLHRLFIIKSVYKVYDKISAFIPMKNVCSKIYTQILFTCVSLGTLSGCLNSKDVVKSTSTAASKEDALAKTGNFDGCVSGTGVSLSAIHHRRYKLYRLKPWRRTPLLVWGTCMLERKYL